MLFREFFLFFARHGDQFALQCERLLALFRGRFPGRVLKVADFAAEKLSLLVHMRNVKAPLAESDNVHSAVFIFLCDFEDFGGTTGARKSIVGSAENAEGLL